jgi:hypothetical protein
MRANKKNAQESLSLNSPPLPRSPAHGVFTCIGMHPSSLPLE